MHCGTGEIFQKVAIAGNGEMRHMGKLLAPLSKRQFNELKPLGSLQRKNNMRNQPCVCGSGVKFKRCCWDKYA